MSYEIPCGYCQACQDDDENYCDTLMMSRQLDRLREENLQLKSSVLQLGETQDALNQRLRATEAEVLDLRERLAGAESEIAASRRRVRDITDNLRSEIAAIKGQDA